ncbi:hypothetical protein LTR28_003532 [Elasticomyces elasticus]|nr:hypothetical protein LTR28_003532 [Elasticomyces elasticus]
MKQLKDLPPHLHLHLSQSSLVRNSSPLVPTSTLALIDGRQPNDDPDKSPLACLSPSIGQMSQHADANSIKEAMQIADENLGTHLHNLRELHQAASRRADKAQGRLERLMRAKEERKARGWRAFFARRKPATLETLESVRNTLATIGSEFVDVEREVGRVVEAVANLRERAWVAGSGAVELGHAEWARPLRSSASRSTVET